MSKLKVHIDNRARLVGALLSAGSWPDREQALQAHAVHAHARQTRVYVEPHSEHPAVVYADRLLEAGLPLNGLYGGALRCTWPTFEVEEELPPGLDEAWPELLLDFYTDTAVAAFFWADHDDVWEKAARQLRQIWEPAGWHPFIERLCGVPLERDVYVLPNLTYPALSPVLASTEDALWLLLPPPPAWGESQPWPYAEGAEWLLSQGALAMVDFVAGKKLSTVPADRRETARRAVVARFLAEAADEATAAAYVVQTRREEDLPDLPLAAEALAAYLEEPGDDFGHIFDV